MKRAKDTTVALQFTNVAGIDKRHLVAIMQGHDRAGRSPPSGGAAQEVAPSLTEAASRYMAT